MSRSDKVVGDSRRGAVLAVAAKASAGIVPGYILLSYLYGPEVPALYPLLVVLLLGSAFSYVLVHRGFLEIGARLIVGQAWAVTSFLVLEQGAHSPHVGAFGPVIVASSLLLSARATVITVLSSLAAFLTAAFLNRQGHYGPTAPLFPDITAPAAHMVFTGCFIALLMNSFAGTLEQLRRKQAELKASQDHLRRAEKMEAIGQLAGGVAHDFNNILTGMLGHIDLLRMKLDEHPGAADWASDLAGLERSAERASDITRQLLTFSRKEVPDTGVANLSRTLEEADTILRRLIREDVGFRVISETSGFVGVTPTALEQILMNLVLNASDAMPRGGAVAITTAEVSLDRPSECTTGPLLPGRYICLSVADTGMGIPGDGLERVFEPFFTTKPAGKGTGLGLSTVLGIVQRAGGQIDVQSTVGAGTTFSVMLPWADEPPPGEAKLTSLPPPEVGSGVVLVCEDDKTILSVLHQVLGGAGYQVEAFSEPAQALARGQQLGSELSLLITDVIMPGMSGPELARTLDRTVPGLPVLFISGYTAGLLADLGIDAHDPRLLTKPFSPRDLLRRVTISRDTETPPGSAKSPA